MARTPPVSDDDDAPELTEAQLAEMRPAREVLPPELYAALTKGKPPRGRPKADETKVAVSIRLDRDVVEAFKATGKGWQTRVNETLVKAAPKALSSYGSAPTGRFASTDKPAKRPSKKRA